MTVGERITYYRTLRGISQKQLAEKSGLTRQTIINYEKEKREPTLINAMCVADCLHISLDMLARGERK